jgi:mutator family transposase
MSVLTDLKNRGVRDVFFVVCDGLKGRPEVVANVWPAAIQGACSAIHAIAPAKPSSLLSMVNVAIVTPFGASIPYA